MNREGPIRFVGVPVAMVSGEEQVVHRIARMLQQPEALRRLGRLRHRLGCHVEVLPDAVGGLALQVWHL
jgi:hypothetical protein